MKNNIAIGLAIGLLIAILSTLLAWGQRNQAISQANVAVMAEKTTKTQRATAEAKVSILQTANTQLVTQQATAEATVYAAQTASIEAQTQQAVAETERDQAMEQLRLTRSRQLAVQALNLLDEQLDLALLLSVEAGHIADTGVARGSLHEALTYKPNLTFLHGHQNSFAHTGIATLSPDGKILVSSSCHQGLPWVSCSDIELRFWDVTTHQPLGLVHPGHEDTISSLAFSPDGKIVASGSDYDTNIMLWDVTTQQSIGQLSTSEIYKVSGLRFSPDGQILASWTDNTLTLWDITTMQPIGQPLTFTMQIVTLSPDQQTLALSRDNDLTLWNVATNQAVGPPLTGHTEPVSEAIFSPNGKLLASRDTNNAIILWDVSTGQSLNQTLKTHGGETHFSAFSSDGQTLAALNDEAILKWDTTTGKLIHSFGLGFTDGLSQLAFRPNGQLLAWGGKGKAIILWDEAVQSIPSRTEVDIDSPLGNHVSVRSIAFSPDGRILASVGCGKLAENRFDCEQDEIRFWDVATGQLARPPLIGDTALLANVVFSPNGQILLSHSVDGTITLWDVTTGQMLGPPLVNHTVIFNPDGQTLALLSDDGLILGDGMTGQPLGPALAGHADTVTTAAFSPNGEILASGSRDCTIILWDVATSQALGLPLTGHTAPVQSVTFSPDGQTLWSRDIESNIILWDVASHSLLTRNQIFLPAHSIYSPDGQIVASYSSQCDNNFSCDYRFIFWNITNGQSINTSVIHGREGIVTAFNADGQILAVGRCTSFDNHGTCSTSSVRLIDVTTGHSIGPEISWDSIYLGDRISSLAFSPDNQTLATATQYGQIIFWDISLESWQGRACRAANRNLTPVEWSLYLGSEPYRQTCPNIDIDPHTAQGMVEQGQAFARHGNIEGAIAQFQQALELDPTLTLDPETEARHQAATSLIKQVSHLARQGEIEEAIATIAIAQTIDTNTQIPPSTLGSLCWYGSLDGYAAEVLDFCEQAVRSQEQGNDSSSPFLNYGYRGLARALTGDYTGAVADLRAYMAKGEHYLLLHADVAFWIQELEAGRNPFDASVLAALRGK